jgi:hypothetical protein
MKEKKIAVIAVIISTIMGFLCGYMIGMAAGEIKGRTHFKNEQIWSIGILTGESPYNLASPKGIENPVLTARDVTDIPASIVADPFLMKEGSTWYLFFEAMDASTNIGKIGYATSEDGFHWTYRHIVIAESFHLSFPYVFKCDNAYYMIPESHSCYSIRLYKAVEFPGKWIFVGDLLFGRNFVDSCIFLHNNRWWIFTSDRNDVMRLYYADKLQGPWVEHPKSPLIVGDIHHSRSAGKVVAYKGKLIRYSMDCYPIYGSGVWAFEIIELTPDNYREKPLSATPVIKGSGVGWNKDGMHTVSPVQVDRNLWIVGVDGFELKAIKEMR